MQKHYGLFILSTAPWKNPTAWSDKVTWVTKYLDDVFHKRMVITHRMDICQGDYLIDDYGKTGQANFLANRLNLARKSSLTGKVYWSI
ncbi:MAG: hypothetical protein IJK22_02905 [Bacteroidales bacterium]|nr:hypothetical protein [Bacteroidales bacterium]